MHACTQVRTPRAAKKVQEVVYLCYSLQVCYCRALCKKKKKVMLHQGQKTIAAQLLGFWGTIELHNVNDLNKGLHSGTVSCVCSDCKELMNSLLLWSSLPLLICVAAERECKDLLVLACLG